MRELLHMLWHPMRVRIDARWARVGRLAALEAEVAALSQLTRTSSERIRALEQLVDQHSRQLEVRTVMNWISHTTLRTTPLVSVVLPTRNRCDLLTRAIASVKNQTYTNWELLIIDDGSTDETPAFLADIRDEQVRSFRAEGAGPSAARNVGLDRARGDMFAYLDDDNIMHPAWLRSVVWGFEQRPEASVLYGAFLVDDPLRISSSKRGDLPRLYFRRYDHHEVANNNIADISCIAHRAGLPEARFDASIRGMGDWDLFLRLTRNAPPFALPAIACFYTTDAPYRISHEPYFPDEVGVVRSKNRRT